MAQENKIIESFLGHYKQSYYFYNRLATLVADQCEKMVNESGIRAIVTSRAKKIKNLKEKIYQRHKTKNYQSDQDIYKDIVDLAGVRIALYFPADRKRVENFITDTFIIDKKVPFPESKTENKKDQAKNKFDGYHAEHYRIMLKPETLEENNKDCANYIVEIQVASILMHAWSEVNHDLAYKPSSGELSQQELSILDGLNGLVLTGEVLLEQLQSAFQKRVSHQEKPFANQYELADFIYTSLNKLNVDMDPSTVNLMYIDLLFFVTEKISFNNPKEATYLIEYLDKDNIEIFGVVDQMFDILFKKDIDLYKVYCDIYGVDVKDNYEYIENVQNFLEVLILLKRYIRYLSHCKNISIFDIPFQEEEKIGFASFSDVCDWINELTDHIYTCSFRDVIRCNDEKKAIINHLNSFDDPDSLKAMEWAGSGQLKLPEE